MSTVNAYAPGFILACLSILFSCTSAPAPLADQSPIKVLILTDSTSWSGRPFQEIRDYYAEQGGRVMFSGNSNETSATLLERLPWLLQPGVDVIYYDEDLVGSAAGDSLSSFLAAMGHPAMVVVKPSATPE